MPTTYAIPDGRTVMAATLYTGNATARTIDNSVNGVSFQPDLVWIKSRSATTNNQLVDAVRGASLGLSSNLTSAEYGVGVNAFASNGFGLTTDGSLLGINVNAATYVGWQWNAGGSTVTNTSGSISAQVRANTTAGFSVVTWTGTGANATVGHGLGVAPSMMILMNRDTTHDSIVWHTAFTATERIYLNLTNAKDTGAATSFNSTLPSSSVISLGSNLYTNGSANKMVAYCFAAVAGYSAFGSYTGNGSTDGPFVYLGFRPRYLLIKNISASEGWEIMDTSRNTYNAVNSLLEANQANAEVTSTSRDTDYLSNGFKVRNTSTAMNTNGSTYIYAAFAENPFKYANAR